MKLPVAVFSLIVLAASVRGDPAMENVQQALKDEGFYYGEVSGEKDADTTAAIRRYQIRNGLQVTGDLNDETKKALGLGPGGSRTVAKASPTAAPDTSDSHNESRGPREPRQPATPTNPLTGQPFPDVSQDRQPRADYRQAPPDDYRQPPPADYRQPPTDYAPPAPGPGGVFVGTPYDVAPPEVQRNIVTSAEAILSQRGLYRGDIDGVFGPNLEFSLRAYQSRVGIPITGRLDLQTLAALELLPGANASRRIPRPEDLPPVRGEWIRER